MNDTPLGGTPWLASNRGHRDALPRYVIQLVGIALEVSICDIYNDIFMQKKLPKRESKFEC